MGLSRFVGLLLSFFGRWENIYKFFMKKTQKGLAFSMAVGYDIEALAL